MTNEAQAPQITEQSLKLFLAYAKDAGNWSGTPLVGGNVGFNPADKGNLTQLKIAGLVTTFEETDVRNGRKVTNSWLEFTEAGKALAAQHGIDVRG